MFTGIVEEVGKVRHVVSGRESGSITLTAKRVLEGTRRGDSIAVNGVCLTVTSLTPDGFTADVMSETLRRTNLGALAAGQAVNLERAMAAGGRFGGHIVTGHIDGPGTVRDVREEGNAHWIRIEAASPLLLLVVEKGSIAIDGVSLTVAKRDETSFSVSLIPTTQAETTLLGKRAGEQVNLETDIIGKYVQALLSCGVGTPLAGAALCERRDGASCLSEEFLRQNGF